MFAGSQNTVNEAKQKMLAWTRRVTEGQPLQLIQSDPQPQAASVQKTTYQEPVQMLGVRRNNNEYFAKCRQKNVDEVAVHTNTLIIRLDKLINVNLHEASRKAYEQKTVAWAEDKEAKACQECGTKFQLYRRRHHCRLCGKIMCHNCSQFMSFVTARKLTNPAFASQILNGLSEDDEAKDSASSDTSSSFSTLKQHTGKLFSMLKNDGSETSLSSILQQDMEEHVRMCGNCKGLLDRRDEQMDQRSSPPIIVQFYDQLCAHIAHMHKVESSYVRMAESLNIGESMYTLADAKELADKLKMLMTQIDVLSHKIEKFGLQDGARQPSASELRLQQCIRANACNVLFHSPIQRVSLPTPEQYEKLQQRFKKRTQEQIEAARTLRSIASSSSLDHHTETQRPLRANTSFSGHARTDEGWNPETRLDRNPFTEDESEPMHPLQEQFRIVKGYLRQAAEAGRLEEVASLEANLQMIEDEMKSLNLNLNAPK